MTVLPDVATSATAMGKSCLGTYYGWMRSIGSWVCICAANTLLLLLLLLPVFTCTGGIHWWYESLVVCRDDKHTNVYTSSMLHDTPDANSRHSLGTNALSVFPLSRDSLSDL